METKTVAFVGIVGAAFVLAILALVGVATGHFTDPTSPIQVSGQFETTVDEREGPQGPQGAFNVSIHQCSDTPLARPSGGTWDLENRAIINVPTGWVTTRQTVDCEAGEERYRADSPVDPALVADDVTGVLLSWSAPLPEGGSGGGTTLAAGSAAEPRLRWDSTRTAWEPTGESETSIAFLVRDVTFDTIKEAIDGWNAAPYKFFSQFDNSVTDCTLDPPGYPPYAFYRYFSSGTSYRQAPGLPCRVNSVWESGGAAPYMLVVTPSWTGWIDDFTFYYDLLDCLSTCTANGPPTTELTGATTVKNDIRIGGESFDVKWVQLTGIRPLTDFPGPSNDARLQWRYTAPAADTTVTEQ